MPNRGQSLVEYVLMFTTVLVVLIIFLSPRGNVIKKPLNELYETASDSASSFANTIFH